MAPHSSREDPFPAFLFKVMIHGVTVGYFREVDGLCSEAEVISYHTTSRRIAIRRGAAPDRDPLSERIQPGMSPASKAVARLVLHGFMLAGTQQHLLRHWVYPGAPRSVTPQGQIAMLDWKGQPLRTWQFHDAWPSKVSGPELNSEGSTVEIVVGRLIRI